MCCSSLTNFHLHAKFKRCCITILLDESDDPLESGSKGELSKASDIKNMVFPALGGNLESLFSSLNGRRTSTTDGIEWQTGGQVPIPINVAWDKTTDFKHAHLEKFISPLSSCLVFFPIEYWKPVVWCTNEYAVWRLVNQPEGVVTLGSICTLNTCP